MQITLTWTCRECYQDRELKTDTADYGVLDEAQSGFLKVDMAHIVPLACSHCGHVSGEVGLGYRYKEEHRPSHE